MDQISLVIEILKAKKQLSALEKDILDTLNEYNLNLDIKRGNISSASFMENGQPILHTAKNEDKPHPFWDYSAHVPVRE